MKRGIQQRKLRKYLIAFLWNKSDESILFIMFINSMSIEHKTTNENKNTKINNYLILNHRNSTNYNKIKSFTFDQLCTTATTTTKTTTTTTKTKATTTTNNRRIANNRKVTSSRANNRYNCCCCACYLCCNKIKYKGKANINNTNIPYGIPLVNTIENNYCINTIYKQRIITATIAVRMKI